MTDTTIYLLYAGAVVAGSLVIFLGYRLFQKRKEEKPKSQVMNKIQDFYSTQDKKEDKPNINY